MTFLTFDMCVKLQRFGVKTRSGFYYQRRGERKNKPVYSSNDIYMGLENFDSVYVPAYISSDLDFAMPASIFYNKAEYGLVIRKLQDRFDVRYERRDGQVLYREYSKSPVEARAKLFLYVLRKGII